MLMRTWITEAIKSRRRIRNMSRRELARMSGVSAQTIHAIEEGKNIPNAATLEAVLRVFGAELVIRDYGED